MQFQVNCIHRSRSSGWCSTGSHHTSHVHRCSHTLINRCKLVQKCKSLLQEAGLEVTNGSKAHRLKEWFVQHSVTQACNLEPRLDSSTGGLVMTTLDPIPKGQVLVTVPLKLMITAGCAEKDPGYGHLITEGPLNEWQALVLALLCERAKGADSFWAPYISQLPSQEDHPLAWGPERLAWLEGSPMKQTLESRQQQVLDDCEVLQLVGANSLPLAQAWSQSHQAVVQGVELVTPESVTWAAATLLSRAFSIDLTAMETNQEDEEDGEEDVDSDKSVVVHNTSAEDVLALVPWADTLNHCSEAGPESCLRYSPEDKAASLMAHRTYQAGEQVYDSYGPTLSPVDLLLDYGFVDASNTNHRADVHPTRIVANKSSRATALLAALARAYSPATSSNEQATITLPVTPSGPDITLLTWTRAALSTDAELIRAGWRVKAGPNDVELACRVMGKLAEPSSPAVEDKVLQAVQDHLQARLAAYPSTMEQDKQECDDAGTSRFRRAALQALASEKYALHGSIHAIVEARQKLEQGCPLNELYMDWVDDTYGFEEDEEGEWDNAEVGSSNQILADAYASCSTSMLHTQIVNVTKSAPQDDSKSGKKCEADAKVKIGAYLGCAWTKNGCQRVTGS